MAFELPALPNVQPNIPQAPPPLETYGRMLQLKELSGQLALQPLRQQQAQQQVQGEALANQKAQLELDSQKALQQAVASGVFNKFAGVQTADGSGFDAAGAYSELLSKHPNILPTQASAAVDSLLKIGQTMAETRKTNAQAAEANAAVRGKTLDALAAKLGAIGDMPATKAAAALDSFHQDLVKNPQAYPGLTQEELAHLYSADLSHLSAMTEYMGLEGKLADFHKSKAEEKTAEQKVIPEGGGLSAEQQAEIQKEHKQAELDQPLKIETAKIEAQVHAQVQASMLPLIEQIHQTFANQKDARDKIESTVLKPFQEKMTDVKMAQTAIAQAQTNPVAARAAVFKMIGVAQPTGSHRVLPAEITAFRYPGGVGTQMVEKFNNFLKGEPWTPEVAAAANAFIDGQAQAAQSSLNSGIDNTNQLYGTKVGTGLQKTLPAAPSGKAVSLAAARKLPMNKGKSDEDIRKDIESHGHQVTD